MKLRNFILTCIIAIPFVFLLNLFGAMSSTPIENLLGNNKTLIALFSFTVFSFLIYLERNKKKSIFFYNYLFWASASFVVFVYYITTTSI